MKLSEIYEKMEENFFVQLIGYYFGVILMIVGLAVASMVCGTLFGG